VSDGVIEVASRCVDYRLKVEYVPRRGLPGLFDRVHFRRAVKRALRETAANLEAQLRA
jgi:hypothetical protein